VAAHRLFAVAVIGRDRPGIVADVTGSLLHLGCNVEDGVTSLLSGQFALMLICSAPPEATLEAMRAALMGMATDLKASVWPLDERAERSRPTHVLTVYGPDRRGIVHEVASVLARHRVNICDMTCRLSGDSSLYALTLEIEPPLALEPAVLEASLREALAPMGLELALGPIESEVL
jgi:glycine cleavage system transcriptional repressor